jgi:hypothetical protein
MTTTPRYTRYRPFATGVHHEKKMNPSKKNRPVKGRFFWFLGHCYETYNAPAGARLHCEPHTVFKSPNLSALRPFSVTTGRQETKQ